MKNLSIFLNILVQIFLLLFIGLIIFIFVANKAGKKQTLRVLIPTGLYVLNNQIVDDAGRNIRLIGVSKSGTEYSCVSSSTAIVGPSDVASIDAMKTWNINVVRVPLNEDCWLGINGVVVGGINYQRTITNYINKLINNGLIVIVELHWSAPGTQKTTGQMQMADADHSITFWTQVASAYKSNTSIIFEPYNEPYNIDWKCWRDGGTCTGVEYKVAGMQQMVNAIRETGATNIIALGGLSSSNDLSGWLINKPQDPQNNLVAVWHEYNFSSCKDIDCWNSQIAPLALKVPIIVTELGENDCSHVFIDGLMNWLDRYNISYLGWAWNTWDCKTGPALISNYDGTPTAFGIGFKEHIASFSAITTSTSQ